MTATYLSNFRSVAMNDTLRPSSTSFPEVEEVIEDFGDFDDWAASYDARLDDGLYILVLCSRVSRAWHGDITSLWEEEKRLRWTDLTQSYDYNLAYYVECTEAERRQASASSEEVRSR
ncbi:hypothetical protein G7K_1515-t1 [Saitoella complicata NRRL Y-17804]|uniref:Uncharacterized protein n=1 Tax=Saitoella complicata (strain BCRC 22490 / CBS 7301 / JCM 7358 / NBRC 10748 / NRRL Y-17804) TaxID=698492 RepID=A0A0E9NC51_SAICN|nr:hypothetical protein G7K_1515-t1 [Saitoella complicata NRRL Y-17804]